MSAELIDQPSVNDLDELGSGELPASRRRPDQPSSDDSLGGGPSADDVAANALIADNLLRLNRTMNRFRATISAAQGDESERMQNHLVFHIAASGPIRASVLAESVEADPSTVSRQVAALVKSGLIERRADPGDGRASLLALTDTGRALHRRHLDRRDAHYGQMLRDWPSAERRTFARLLAQFADDFDSYKSAILAEVCAPRATASREEQE